MRGFRQKINSRRTPRPEQQPTLRIELLEPRLLLSADALSLAGLPGLDAPRDDPPWADNDTSIATGELLNELPVHDVSVVDTTTATDTSHAPPRQVVFVDTAVTDRAALLERISEQPDSENLVTYLLDGSRDGIAQITEVLNQHQEITAVHLVSHGNEEGLQLGTTWLDSENYKDFNSDFAVWSESLTKGADLLIYGCDVAADVRGQAMVDAIAAATQSDVAASMDRTGNPSASGDWDLEYEVGTIETNLAVDASLRQAFSGTLGLATFQVGFGGYTAPEMDDTYIDGDSPTTSFGLSDDLTVADNTRQALVRFDNIFAADGGSIPDNALINSATLTLDVSGTNSDANISIYRMLTGWSYNSEWNDFSGGGAGIQFDGSEAVSAADDVVDGGDSTAVFDVTASLNQWSRFGATNFGWVLDSDDGSDWKGTSQQKGTPSDRPLLTVDYTPTSADLLVTNNSDSISGVVNTGTIQVGGDFGADGVSLREAIYAANNTAGTTVVGLQIGSGVQTIQPNSGSALPDIGRPIVLDATTQPGYSGTPLIQIDGSLSSPGHDGFTIAAGGAGSTLRGFAIYNFQDYGIVINGGSGNTIEANYIGTDANATVDSSIGNGSSGTSGGGILVSGSSANMIGGADAAERNIIVQNSGAADVSAGIEITGAAATGNQVFGNYIGLGPDGSTAMGNAEEGIRIRSSANGNFIGGSNPGEGNIISANGDEGIVIDGAGSDGNFLQGNYIGLNNAGDDDRGNVGHGILVSAGASGNTAHFQRRRE